MVSIDYAKLDEVSVALKKLYEMLQYNLEESKLGYNSIYITPLEALKCPEIGGFEDDMNKLQARGNEALDDIQKLITGIHNVINKFQETESKLERDVNAATVSSSTLLGAGVLSTSALMMLGMESGVQAFGSKDDASFSDKAVASQGTSGIVASDRKDVTGIAVGAIGINMKTQQSKGVNVAKTSSKTSSEDNKILDAVLQWGENLGDHPVDTGMAVLGVGLGAIGVVGSGALEYFSIGTASPATVPVAAFSLNSIISSGFQLVDITGGNYKNQRNLNLLKSGSEILVGE